MKFDPMDLAIAEWFFDNAGATCAMHYLFSLLAELDAIEEECLCHHGWRHCAKHEAQRADPVHQDGGE
jgi:hypothetical protein